MLHWKSWTDIKTHYFENITCDLGSFLLFQTRSDWFFIWLFDEHICLDRIEANFILRIFLENFFIILAK